LKSALHELAPTARIFAAEGGLPFEGIEALLSHALEVGQQRQWQEQDVHNHALSHDHEHQHGETHESIHTCSFILDKPVERAHFEQFLHGLPKTVYRAKGFVTFVGNAETFVFQYLPGYVFIQSFPLRNRSLLQGVFIGQNLDKEWIAMQLWACQQTEMVQ